jgi:hypothetical protein
VIFAVSFPQKRKTDGYIFALRGRKTGTPAGNCQTLAVPGGGEGMMDVIYGAIIPRPHHGGNESGNHLPEKMTGLFYQTSGAVFRRQTYHACSNSGFIFWR